MYLKRISLYLVISIFCFGCGGTNGGGSSKPASPFSKGNLKLQNETELTQEQFVNEVKGKIDNLGKIYESESFDRSINLNMPAYKESTDSFVNCQTVSKSSDTIVKLEDDNKFLVYSKVSLVSSGDASVCDGENISGEAVMRNDLSQLIEELNLDSIVGGDSSELSVKIFRGIESGVVKYRFAFEGDMDFPEEEQSFKLSKSSIDLSKLGEKPLRAKFQAKLNLNTSVFKALEYAELVLALKEYPEFKISMLYESVKKPDVDPDSINWKDLPVYDSSQFSLGPKKFNFNLISK